MVFCCFINCISSRFNAFEWIWPIWAIFVECCCCKARTNLIKSNKNKFLFPKKEKQKSFLPSFVDDWRSSGINWIWLSLSVSLDDNLLLKLNDVFNIDVEWEYKSPFWFNSFDDNDVGNPLDGPDVHGDDGQVAGDKNFVLERVLIEEINRKINL